MVRSDKLLNPVSFLLFMPNPELVTYFNKYKRQYDLNQLKQSLINQGYKPAEVEEAAQIVWKQSGPLPPSSPLPPPSSTSSGTAKTDNIFTIDQQTKETIVASVTGLVLAEIIIFFGDFLISGSSIIGIIWTLIYAVLGGLVAGFILAKFYDSFMDFISQNLKFLMPLCDTFFKLLFLPVVIGAAIALLFSLLAGGLIFAAGASLGGVGVLGGLLGGSIILGVIWGIIVTVAARYLYAKYMVSKVGHYYRDYKQ